MTWFCDVVGAYSLEHPLILGGLELRYLLSIWHIGEPRCAPIYDRLTLARYLDVAPQRISQLVAEASHPPGSRRFDADLRPGRLHSATCGPTLFRRHR